MLNKAVLIMSFAMFVISLVALVIDVLLEDYLCTLSMAICAVADFVSFVTALTRLENERMPK